MKDAVLETHQNRGAEGPAAAPADTALVANPGQDGPDWLALAQSTYEASTNVLDANLRDRWEKAYRAFNGLHQTNSKYYSADYKHRSKMFRPKTRAAIRKNEAAAAAAFFSTEDVVNVAPANDAEEIQQDSADLWHEVMNYRLKHTIKWFLICIGAYQAAETVGACISKQFWRYEERQTGVRTIETYETNEMGEEVLVATEEEPVYEIIRDEPCIELTPIENIRFDIGANWLDPINTSPYLIHLTPRYAVDVKAIMTTLDPKTGKPKWKEYGDEEIASAIENRFDSTRQAREGEGRSDSTDQNQNTVRDFDIVWTREYFMRVDGEDWTFETLGGKFMLTEPKKVSDIYWHCKNDRPFVMGHAIIEAHKTYPVGKPALMEGLQQHANEIVNTRIDGVRLAMQGRPVVVAGRGIDLQNLRRWASGSPIMVKNKEDVDWIQPREVAASAYNEQDRLNVDMDEIAGAFSPGSVQSNRKLNETVGGLNILNNDANIMSEYDLRVFSETWVEPMLRQLVRLEQAYETDMTILALAGNKAQVVQKYGQDRFVDQLLEHELTVRVNVGIGATDPMKRLERFLLGTRSIVELIVPIIGPQAAAQLLNIPEHIEEIYGHLGYKDGKRFYNLPEDEDPRIQQMQQAIEELQSALESKQMELDNKVEVARIGAEADLEEQAMEDETAIMRDRMKYAAEARQAGAQAIVDAMAKMADIKAARETAEKTAKAANASRTGD